MGVGRGSGSGEGEWGGGVGGVKMDERNVIYMKYIVVCGRSTFYVLQKRCTAKVYD